MTKSLVVSVALVYQSSVIYGSINIPFSTISPINIYTIVTSNLHLPMIKQWSYLDMGLKNFNRPDLLEKIYEIYEIKKSDHQNIVAY